MSDEQLTEVPEKFPANYARSRKIILCSGLVFAIGLFLATRWQQSTLEAQVAPLAQQHLQENNTGTTEAASSVTVSRDALLFGTPRAKVSVYVRPTDPAKADTIHEIDYNYFKQDGQWKLDDSGACSGPECVLRGREAFRKKP